MNNDIFENTIKKDHILTDQEKAISLYKFIGELSALKQKPVLNIREYSWSCFLRSIPVDTQNIKIYYRDRVVEEDFDSNNALLRVHKPEFEKCPEPDQNFANWLYDGWKSFRNEAHVHETRKINTDDKPTINAELQNMADTVSLFNYNNGKESDDNEDSMGLVEHFTDDEQRTKSYENWLYIRNKWIEKQIIIDQTREFFTNLYKLHVDLERDSETLEMVVANGLIRDNKNSDIHHPVITRRVKTSFDPVANTVSIKDTDVETDLYVTLFHEMNDINLNSIISLRDDLQNNDYHPMDRNDTPLFLKMLIHQLSSESVFSEDGEPEEWNRGNRLLLYMNPMFIVRKRVDGTKKAVEKIIENIEKTGYIPSPLVDIVNGGKIEIPNDEHEDTIEEQLAAVGGENVDIFLSKETNKEQLEIAQRIELYNAVLVQGPPGTGKTHTIANLMGHFFAQGKSVLVTSHTKKALTVLKEKVAPGLQNLCVSVLDDSNEDMEQSIDSITDYMSKYTSHVLKNQMAGVAQERRQIIADLAETRKKLFAIINSESSNIVINGEEISPSKAAAFVQKHEEDLSYIPGKVRLYASLPVSFAELASLYRSNEGISVQDETELAYNLPNPELLLTPLDFEKTWQSLQVSRQHLASIADAKGWNIQPNNDNTCSILFDTQFGKFHVDCPAKENLDSLSSYIESFGNIETWMKYAAVDGKKGGSFRQRWITLIEQIRKSCDYAESVVSEQFGKDIRFTPEGQSEEILPILIKLKAHLAKKGKVTKFDLLINSSFKTALSAVTIDSMPVQNANDCDIIMHIIELDKIKKQCAVYWNDLLSVHGVPTFFDLDTTEPERIAIKWIKSIQRCLDWYQSGYSLLIDYLTTANIPKEIVFQTNILDSELTATDRILSTINDIIPPIIDACRTILKIQRLEKDISKSIATLNEGKHIKSVTCRIARQAMGSGDSAAYAKAFRQLETIYEKYDLHQKREDLIKKIAPVAPQWAEAIKNRDGIHGDTVVPSTIEGAWKWKQYSGIIANITAEPFDELQSKSISLSKRYRKITAKYAEISAWYHLLCRTECDIDMKQALQGWKLTVKKIGKGTGKNAPLYKAKARELMAKCQTAVPGWIMPMNRALESLDPKTNRFDIIIVDEASQSDVCALAIAYMAKKIIIVGDDKQVSPMAIGTEVDKVNDLIKMYLEDVIPNAHLYRPNTSLYDVALMTFQPLMLLEHFRCVPEIIGFSNSLSYDFKIKPLRDAGDCLLLPSVINYRVAGGEREKHIKANLKEAQTIVALLIACMEQPEYKGKTFGVISLLGDEQAKRIQALIFEHIDAKDIEQRRIMCGNASNFQGDERDVIFLSVVDSNPGPGPLPLRSFGAVDANRKRYNVATSRARDQLWVIDSLDSANDLKPDDIRKRLIDYSLNPSAFNIISEEIDKKAESPFETAVAKALVSRGYHLVQQWKVGAYRLDMVAVCGKKKVAIECDGERYHSGEAKIREDMERQTILERIGWKFIRIRGSEYFRNPEKTMERVISELAKYGIKTEEQNVTSTETRATELLQRTKARAAEILSDFDKEGLNQVDTKTIGFALGDKEKVINIANGNNESDQENQGSSAPMSLEVNSDDSTEIAPPIFQETAIASSETFDASKQMRHYPVSGQNPKYSKKKNSSGGIVTKNVSNVQRKKNKAKTRLPQEKTYQNHDQLTVFEAPIITQAPNDVISLIKAAGIEYIDKREKNGALWIVGDQDELSDFVKRCRELGVYFTFKLGGGRATKGHDGWWTK